MSLFTVLAWVPGDCGGISDQMTDCYGDVPAKAMIVAAVIAVSGLLAHAGVTVAPVLLDMLKGLFQQLDAPARPAPGPAAPSLGAPPPPATGPLSSQPGPQIRVHPAVPLYTGGKVEGWLQTGGQGQHLVSGETGPGRWLKDNLPGGPGSGLTRAWTHVEGHSAGVMHQTGAQYAVLSINKIPCATGAAKCRYVLHKLLPGGAVLDVRFPNEFGGVTTWRFIGGVKGWSER